MGSWKMQEHWDLDLFCFGGGRICGVFPPLLRVGTSDLPIFLLHLRTAFFEAHLLSPSKILQLWTLKSYKVLMETPYTIVTPYKTWPGPGFWVPGFSSSAWNDPEDTLIDPLHTIKVIPDSDMPFPYS